jgi:hypothetical protein
MRGKLGNTLTAYGYAERKRDEVTEFKTTRLAPGLNVPIPA